MARSKFQEMEAAFEADIANAIAARKGEVPVGNSLSLLVRGGSAIWLYRFREGASMRTLSLGSYPEKSLYAARKDREGRAADRRAGRIERRGARVINSAEPASHSKAKGATIKRQRFAETLEAFIALNACNWKNGLDGNETHRYRKLGTGSLAGMFVDEIGTADVEKALEPWSAKLSSADKNRIRLKLVFDYARAKGLRDKHAVNPANKDDFKYLIPAAPKSVPRKPMPSAELPAFFAELLADGSEAARALAFLILTTTRTDETKEAVWEEFDFKNMVWTLPPDRHKEGKHNGELKIALTPAMLPLLGEPKKAGRVFPGFSEHRDELLDQLRAMRPGKGYTVHGMRTALKGDWAVRAGYPVEFREMALGHKIDVKQVPGYNIPASRLHEIIIPMRLAWCDFATGS